MAGNIEIKVDGTMNAEIGLRGIAGKRDNVKKLVEQAAVAASTAMYARAPRGRTLGLSRRIDWQRAEFRPGGSGGGGTWVARAGVTAGDPYPTHVFRGTGIYGPEGQPITARTGNVMVIDNYKQRDMDFSRNFPVLRKPRPGPIFTRSIKGQKPQREWFIAGQETAEWYLATYYHRIFE